ncbi:MAG: hypothetical protein NZ870_00790 [bacterium]|nr:hypothetical protein [bacterium]
MLYLTILSLLPPFSFYRTGPPTIPSKLEEFYLDEYRISFENRTQRIKTAKTINTNIKSLTLTTPLYRNNILIETAFGDESSDIFSQKYGKIGFTGNSKYGRFTIEYKGLSSEKFGNINILGFILKTAKREFIIKLDSHNYSSRLIDITSKLEFKTLDFTNSVSITTLIADKYGYNGSLKTGYIFGVADFDITLAHGKYAYDTLNFYNQNFKNTNLIGFAFGVKILPGLYAKLNTSKISYEDINIFENNIKISYNW